MAKSKLYNAFLVLVGIVVGTFVGNLCKGINALSWLAFGIDFGMNSPLSLDLGIMQLTFAISINLTLAVVLFIILALVIGRALAK